VAESGEDGDVHDQVDLGVEIATEHGGTSGCSRQLAVGVVEQRPQLQECCTRDQVAPEDQHRREETGDPVGKDHRDR
jgi:hypothetical protein